MTTTEIAQRLNAKPTGPMEWTAICPGHDDTNASLSVTEGRDGKTLLHCHAGCTTEQIVAAVGLKMSDLFQSKTTSTTPAPSNKTQSRKTGKVHPDVDTAAKAAAWAVGKKMGHEWRETRRDFYHDADGRIVAAVLRFDRSDGAMDSEGKAIKTFRPIHVVPGGWKLGDPPGLWPPFNLPEILKSVGIVCVNEGEKACVAGIKIGLTCSTSAHGAKAPNKTDWSALAGHDVVILSDNDKAGRGYADKVAGLVHAAGARSVKIVELPGLPPKGDLFDFVALRSGQSPEAIRAQIEQLITSAPVWSPPAVDAEAAETNQAQDQSAAMPIVRLPHGIQAISATGHALGTLLARTERFFVRGGAVAKLTRDSDGLPVLDDVHPATLASDFETVAILCKIEEGKPKPATCSEATAKLISASAAFRNAMSPLTVLTRCPVLIYRAGKLMQICGYDRQSGIFAAGQPAEAMSIDEARRLLYEILLDFKFATRADRARALAAMITPSLIFGGLLRCRAPVDLGEANDTQSGKGFRNRQTAALYAQSVKTVAQKKGGVGSMEENFNMALIRGANFISLDNVRGKLDSPSIESFLTEDNYLARGPYMAPTEIDPRRIVVMMTSNKADITPDFSKRCSCVRILKQDDGYVFKPYPEGDILEHIRANQPRFLGAVFSIIFAWNAAGRPKTTETRHDFRPWAQTLDWITQNLLDAGPLLDGHRETQARMTNPVLNWLRDVAIEIIRAKQANAWLRASDLVDLLAETAIETPGLPEHGDLTDPETRKAAQQATGRKLGLCFRAGDILTLDGMTIERREEYDPASRYTVREYRFTAAAMEPEPIAAQPSAAPETPPERAPEQAEIDLCGYAAASRAASHAAKETPVAANAANTYLQGIHLDTLSDVEGINISAMGTISRIAAKSATEDEINNAFDLSSRADYTDTEEGEI